MVTLREIRDGDEEWIFEACQDPEIQRWTRVPRPYQRSHAEEFVATRGLAELAVWVVCDDERPIGVIGVHSVDPTTGDAEIGYWVAPWGRGRRATSMAIEGVARRGHTSRLYRNEGGLRFRDVTAAAGVAHDGLAMGVAAGDYDEDGDADLYVTRAGPNLLLRNRGDGTFEDATQAAGVPGAGEIGAGTALADVDGDGLLDIFAPGYIVFDAAAAPERTIEGGWHPSTAASTWSRSRPAIPRG